MMLSSLYAKLGIGLLAAILIGLAAFTLNKMVNKIAQQGEKIAHLETDLRTEKAARQADVAGLTTLSQGVVAASSAHALDDKILSETINAQNPQPVSPGLSSFLDGLRGTPGPNRPATGPANGAHRPVTARADSAGHQ